MVNVMWRGLLSSEAGEGVCPVDEDGVGLLVGRAGSLRRTS